MRIISGIAGGLKLASPKGQSLRPTEDRVKESLFSTLGDLRGKNVLDLFSGTGALGLEALSRGAASVVMVEIDQMHAQFIRKNLEAVQKSMCSMAGNAQLLCVDANKIPSILQEQKGKIDVILADPPYHSEGFGAEALVRSQAYWEWLQPGAILALEHSSEILPPWEPETPWRLLKQKTFGIRAISFAKLENASQLQI